MHIGFQLHRRKIKRISLQRVRPMFVLFFFCLLFLFSLFSYIHTSKQLLLEGSSSEKKITSLTMMSNRLSIALLGTDLQAARTIYAAHSILQDVANNKPFLPEKSSELRMILQALASSEIPIRFPEFLREIYPLLQKLAEYPDDILSLLGDEREQSYLFVLQNVAEKRPNGGFFGSFALIKIRQGAVTHLEILDSYLPGYDNPQTSITGPEWLYQFLPERQIYFVGANKVGFTYHDGANIKTLYEKSYPGQQIRGVIFLRTDMFEQILPGFTRQLREWQFVNASIDLIRGEERRGKKELYLEGSQNYFIENKTALLQGLITQLAQIIKEKFINIYLENVSGGFHTFLRQNNLTTRFEDDHMYLRNSNISFNKTDRFVSKEFVCKDEQGQVAFETTKDITRLDGWETGTYSCSLTYTLNIPDVYKAYVQYLEKKYDISLGQREKHILGLTETRGTRGIIYVPFHISILSIQGETQTQNIFDTPFAHGAMYTAQITGNNNSHTISLDLYVGEHQ